MTDKRFELNEPFFKQINANNYIIIPILDNGKEISVVELVKLLNELHEKNQDLKKELQTYHKVAGCFNCHYHHYDWFDDGDEFEVCDKGNDVTECICEEWEEL